MKRDVWADTEPAPLEASELATSGIEALRSPLLDAKVMMVDDEPLMTDLIQAHLEDAGYVNFVVTNDPLAAIDMLRREKPGVLLLDLMMPRLSGFELLQAIRADRELRYTPVIVLTAAANAASKLQALQLGATDFLAKPVDASELVLRLRNTLAFQQYHQRQLHFDEVTGLRNERQFETGVDALLKHLPVRGGQLALFSIMVPACRQLRESIDRETADGLAVVLARRLGRLAAPTEDASFRVGGSQPSEARVARLGEQHFALVLEELADADAVEAAAGNVLAALSEPVRIGIHEIAPMPWLGIAVAPGDGLTASALVQSADLAASYGRQNGSGQITFASPQLNAKLYQRLLLGGQLRGAAERGELRLHYQPKVAVASGRIVGVEALVRWQHPEHGLVPPVRFISLAEELGLMPAIGRWVIEQACRDTAAWRRAGLPPIYVAVNVSRAQFVAGDLVGLVSDAMRDSGIPPGQLMVEITESLLMDDVQQALSLMLELKSIGVRLSLDDFGTGYSSLSYLKKFPIDELKIDQSFVFDLPGQSSDAALVRAIVDLGHSLGMSVTAEGVETPDQLACLGRLGCDTFQGFLFSPPVTSERIVQLLGARAIAERG